MKIIYLSALVALTTLFTACANKVIEFDVKVIDGVPEQAIAGEIGTVDWALFGSDGNGKPPVVYDQKSGADIFSGIDATLENKNAISSSWLKTNYTWTDGEKFKEMKSPLMVGFSFDLSKEDEPLSSIALTLQITPEVQKITIFGSSYNSDTKIEAITQNAQLSSIVELPEGQNRSFWTYEIELTKQGTQELKIHVQNIQSTRYKPSGNFGISGIFIN